MKHTVGDKRDEIEELHLVKPLLSEVGAEVCEEARLAAHTRKDREHSGLRQHDVGQRHLLTCLSRDHHIHWRLYIKELMTSLRKKFLTFVR